MMCLKEELELGSRRSKDGKNSGSDEPRFMSSTTLNREPESKSQRKGKVIMISYPMYDFSLRESNTQTHEFPFLRINVLF